MGKESDSTIQQKLNTQFPCREKQVELLCNLLNQNSYSMYQHPCILLHGNQSTGKLSLIKHFLNNSENTKHVIANCTPSLYPQAPCGTYF
ncbi:hypothetical protein WDU94_000807, partial [Cyamophila willieti]